MGQGSCPHAPRYWRYIKRYYNTNKCVLASRDTSMYYYSMGMMVPENKNTRGLRYEIVHALKIMNVPEQAYVVLVKENDIDNIGVGGILISDKHK